MRYFIRAFLLLFVITNASFALTPYEKAIIADEEGDIDNAIEYLFEALDSPGNQEIEIRYFLNDYLILLEDQDLIDQNQVIIDQLLAAENTSESIDNQALQSASGFSPWNQAFSINNNYTILPFDGQVEGLYDQTYSPEIGYSIGYYNFVAGLHHSVDLSVNYEQSLYQSTYALRSNSNSNATSSYVNQVTTYDSLNEYSFSSQLSYFLYDLNWYINSGLELLKGDYYDLSFGAYTYIGYTPFEGTYGKLGINLGANIHQEFGSTYSIGTKYSKNLLNRSLLINLAYNFSIYKADPYEGASMTAVSFDASGAISEQFNYGFYDVKQDNSTHSLNFKTKIKPTSTFSISGESTYSVSQNLEKDIWYTPDTQFYSVVGEADEFAQNYYFNNQIYAADPSVITSENSGLITHEDFLTLLKLKLKGSLAWEFSEDHFFNFSYTKYFQRNLGIDTALEAHPFYSEDLENSTYINFEYLVEF